MDNQPHLVPNAAGVPTPADNEHLLSEFPEEVWRLILANVDSASDYNKICSASLAFWEWFSDQRVHVLFEPVMNVLTGKNYLVGVTPEPIFLDNVGETSEAGDGEAEFGAPTGNVTEETKEASTDSAENDEQDPEETENEMESGAGDEMSSSSDSNSEEEEGVDDWENPYHYLAPLRLVCRSWRDAVDRIIQGPTPTGRELEVDYFFSKFKRVADFHRFENHFFSTHFTSGANPFPARTVEIRVSHEIGDQHLVAFYNACLQMLRTYGHHIHYLHLVMDITDSSEQLCNFYLQLKEMLSLLPALKVLFVFLGQCNLTEAQVTELVSTYKTAMTPILPATLTNLVFHNGDVPSRLLKQLLLQAPATLTSLSVEWDTMANFRLFFDDDQLCLPLTKLKVCLTGKPVSLDEIWATLKARFEETVTYLDLCLPLLHTSVVEPRLGFPKLKRLDLRICGITVLQLDNLLSAARNLETLNVKIFAKHRSKEEVESLTEAYRKQQDESDFWKLFPQLMVLWIMVNLGKEVQYFQRSRLDWKAGKPATVVILS